MLNTCVQICRFVFESSIFIWVEVFCLDFEESGVIKNAGVIRVARIGCVLFPAIPHVNWSVIRISWLVGLS